MLRSLGAYQQPLVAVAERMLASRKPPLKPIVMPQGFTPIPATSEEDLDRMVSRLASRADAWAAVGARARAALLRRCIDCALDVYEEAAEAAVKAKGSWGYGLGEDILSWALIVGALREYAESLEAGGTLPPYSTSRRPNGQHVLDVFPQGIDSLVYGGFRGEIWVLPGHEPTQGALYKAKEAGEALPKDVYGGVALVLGAGNQLPVAALDCLHALIKLDAVVVLKMNPVNEYLGPFVRRAFQPLADEGFLEVCYGGSTVGSYLCDHPLVSRVHLTGSVATYDAIVWRGQVKQSGVPPFKKPVTAELGNVSPYIIVPGPWTDADLEYHADAVATGLSNNAGHNCIAAEVVVTDAEWPLRERFLDALRRRLRATPPRVAYYPGSSRKYQAFVEKFPDAEIIGAIPDTGDAHASTAPPKVAPWVLKAGLTPDEAATSEETWCGTLQEVALPGCGGDAATFLPAAVAYANNQLFGSLACVLVVHPKTQKKCAKEFDAAIAGLKYGGIAVNVPTFVSFAIPRLGFGGHPGCTSPESIGSGNCFVHNTSMVDHIEKNVVYGPWRISPTPFWSATHRNAEGLGRSSLGYFAAPSLRTMVPLISEAMLG